MYLFSELFSTLFSTYLYIHTHTDIALCTSAVSQKYLSHFRLTEAADKKEPALFDRSDSAKVLQTTTCPARETTNCRTFQRKTHKGLQWSDKGEGVSQFSSPKKLDRRETVLCFTMCLCVTAWVEARDRGVGVGCVLVRVKYPKYWIMLHLNAKLRWTYYRFKYTFRKNPRKLVPV